jgi:hypothetical protein
MSMRPKTAWTEIEMKNKIPKNERWLDRDAREAREDFLDVVLFVAALPVFYAGLVLVMCL